MMIAGQPFDPWQAGALVSVIGVAYLLTMSVLLNLSVIVEKVGMVVAILIFVPLMLYAVGLRHPLTFRRTRRLVRHFVKYLQGKSRNRKDELLVN